MSDIFIKAAASDDSYAVGRPRVSGRAGRRALLALCLAAGCAAPSFSPPDVPEHERSRDGALHAAGAETPFLCRPAGSGLRLDQRRPRDDDEDPGIRCTPSATRPPDARLSCDSLGCHGGYDHSTDPATTPRHLRGSNGPSCYTCHGEEWKNDR